MRPESWAWNWRWITLIGAVVVGVVVLVVVMWPRSNPAAVPESSPSVSTGVSSTAEPSGTASAAPATTGPSSTSPQSASPYCVAFGAIKAGGVSTGKEGDSVDFNELSDRFDDLITKYSAAEKVAPADLKDDYARVLGYLRQSKKAVDSRNLEQIKAMVRNLSTLNATMESIQSRSERLCP